MEQGFLKHRVSALAKNNQNLTGIVILQQAHLVIRVNSHLGSKVTHHLCYAKLLTQPCSHAFAPKRTTYLYKQAHSSSSTPPTRPFTYLLTKLGTCTPTHEHTPSARAHPDNKNMSIHTLQAGKRKKKKNMIMP